MKKKVTYFFYLSALFIFCIIHLKKKKKSCHVAFVFLLAHLSLMFTGAEMFKRQKTMLFYLK